MDKEQVLVAAKTLLKCDAVRISQPSEGGRMFLIIGDIRNTKDDKGFWSQSSDGVAKLKNWDYLNEKTIAKGYTADELMADVELYEKLCRMTFTELLKDPELFNKFLNSLA